MRRIFLYGSPTDWRHHRAFRSWESSICCLRSFLFSSLSLNLNGNTFTRETHLAISHTTNGLLQLSNFLNELNLTFLLPGRIQTDGLEARFGKYRTMAGSQYLISIRQVFDVESKIRIQNVLP
jgi:hypothetical protein